MQHPHDRMAASKAVNQERNRIRGKLQLQGTKMLNEMNRELNKVTDDFDNIEMLVACLSSGKTYVNIRKALMPEIADDGITNSINGKTNLIKNQLNLK